MSVKIGDKVRFLNAVGGGIVTKIADNIAYVEDEDGFVTPVLTREVVVVVPDAARTPAMNVVTPDVARPSNPVSKSNLQAIDITHEREEELLEPYVETPEGERLNIQLSFLPLDLKKLSETEWEVTLVNDSNYWLSFSLLSKGERDKDFTLRCNKTIEPGTQVFIEDLTGADINNLQFLRFQCVAFKKDKTFAPKPVVDVEQKLDLTKFFKLHCYQPDLYYEEPVLSVILVKDDKPVRPVEKLVDSHELEDELKRKKQADLKPVSRRIKKRQPQEDPMAPLVVDLHIEELVDNLRGLTPADMLNRQIDEFRDVMDANLRYKGKKIVFIHGKGEGVLRNAILKELRHRYKGIEAQDASFKEYGFGATQVIIR